MAKGDDPGGLHLQFHEVQRGVVEHHHLRRQTHLHQRQQLTQQHGQAAVPPGEGDGLPVPLPGQYADRLRDGIGHRPVREGAEQPAPPVHFQVARGVHHGGEPTSGMKTASSAASALIRWARYWGGWTAAPRRAGGGQVVQLLPGLGVVLQRGLQVVVFLRFQQRQQGRRGLGYPADQGDLDRVPLADLLTAQIHLDHLRAVGGRTGDRGKSVPSIRMASASHMAL